MQFTLALTYGIILHYKLFNYQVAVIASVFRTSWKRLPDELEVK
jgi:hypothetical protein